MFLLNYGNCYCKRIFKCFKMLDQNYFAGMLFSSYVSSYNSIFIGTIITTFYRYETRTRRLIDQKKKKKRQNKNIKSKTKNKEKPALWKHKRWERIRLCKTFCTISTRDVPFICNFIIPAARTTVTVDNRLTATESTFANYTIINVMFLINQRTLYQIYRRTKFEYNNLNKIYLIQ